MTTTAEPDDYDDDHPEGVGCECGAGDTGAPHEAGCPMLWDDQDWQ